MIDLKALQEKLLELNLGISFLKNPKVAAWVFVNQITHLFRQLNL